MVDKDGTAYGVPLNYVWDGKNSIFIHCAPVGRKLEALEKNPNVSFCIVGAVKLLPGKFTTRIMKASFEGHSTYPSLPRRTHGSALKVSRQVIT